MDPDLLSQVAQFGTAGLIAWMWLTERKSSLARETQLTEAHERILEHRTQLDALMRLVTENTRALASLESGLAAIHRIIERTVAPTRSARHQDQGSGAPPSAAA